MMVMVMTMMKFLGSLGRAIMAHPILLDCVIPENSIQYSSCSRDRSGPTSRYFSHRSQPIHSELFGRWAEPYLFLVLGGLCVSRSMFKKEIASREKKGPDDLLMGWPSTWSPIWGMWWTVNRKPRTLVFQTVVYLFKYGRE